MQSTNKKRVSQRNTQTVLESPEAEQYSLHEGNPCQKLRVMAKLTLPKLKVPKKRIIKLEEKDKIVVEIYMITSKTTGKSYIGQARSHTKLDEFYVRHGAKGRFKQHVHYAKKGESRRDYAELHKDIKKYGAENFEVQVLGIVSQEDAGKHELLAIGHYMTLVPYGYNIMNYNQNFHNRKDGGKKLSEASKKPLEKRTQIRISQDVDPKDIIRPLRRYGRHYGWYILYEGYKTDFGGVHDPLEVSYKRAYEYVLTCQGLDSKDCELPEMKLNPTRDKRLDIKDQEELKLMAQRTEKQFDDAKLEKFSKIEIPEDVDLTKFLKTHKCKDRNGWRFDYKGIRVVFTGSVNDSDHHKQRALSFIDKLKSRKRL